LLDRAEGLHRLGNALHGTCETFGAMNRKPNVPSHNDRHHHKDNGNPGTDDKASSFHATYWGLR
jgi:hypothetical protein